MVELRADPSWRLPALAVVEAPPTHTMAGTEPPRVISPSQIEFANLELSRPLEYRERRVEAIGFTGMSRVLDVACGVGQWSIALGLHNDEVHGIDRVEERLAVGELIARNHGRTNIHFTHGDAEALPYADDWFDAIFSYSTLIYLAPEIALAEFCRVLKPGGRLYISANGLGWSLWLMFRRRLWSVGWNTIQRTRYGMPRDNFLTRARMESLLGEFGFRLDAWGGEGRLRAQGREAMRFDRVYPSRFLGFQAVWELLATRLEADSSMAPDEGARPTVDYALASAQEFDAPEHSVDSDVIRIEQPADDGPDYHYSAAKRERVETLDGVDRDAALAAVAQEVTSGQETPGAQVEAAIRFCQDSIYHHPVEQPPLTLHPLETLRVGEGRCGHVARLLVTLLRGAGFSARTRQLRDHVVAEVFLADEWRIADADAFKNGVIPKGVDGLLLSMRDVEHNPYRIDSYQPSGWWVQPGTHYVRNAVGETVTGYVDALPPDERGFLSNRYAWWLDPTYPPSVPVLDNVDSPSQPGKIALSWAPSSDPDGDLEGYTVRVGTTSRGWSYDSAVYERLTAETGTEIALVETSETVAEVTIESPGTYFWSVSAFDAHRALEPNTFYWSSDEGSFEVR